MVALVQEDLSAVSERIDIAAPIAEICRRLGFDPNVVSRLDMKPREITVERFKVDGRGDRFIQGDKPVMEEPVTVEVITHA